jgi:hypothetical protein
MVQTLLRSLFARGGRRVFEKNPTSDLQEQNQFKWRANRI